jgi:hypothetical protein
LVLTQICREDWLLGTCFTSPRPPDAKQSIEYARRAVAEVFQCDDKFLYAASSEWLKDEYSKGGYTYAIPGGVCARELLKDTKVAKELLANQIFPATVVEFVAAKASCFNSLQRPKNF